MRWSYKLWIKMCVYVGVSWQNVSLQFNCKDWTVWVSEVLLNLTLGSDVFCMCGQAGHSLVWAWHQTFLSYQPWLLYSNYPVNLSLIQDLQYTEDWTTVTLTVITSHFLFCKYYSRIWVSSWGSRSQSATFPPGRTGAETTTRIPASTAL